jgi:uncharacterized membrane protein
MKLADRLLIAIGSWLFLVAISLAIAIWVYLNPGFDPYPHILLNLILSCIAALQTPIILISQRRVMEEDRELLQKILQKLDE